MPDPLLDVRHLRVEFPTRRGTLVALDDISFSIAPGEILGVVGESGAGKSLTGAAIIGLLDPPGRIAAGEIRFDGRRIDNLPYEEMRRVRGRSIGAIFQDHAGRPTEQRRLWVALGELAGIDASQRVRPAGAEGEPEDRYERGG